MMHCFKKLLKIFKRKASNYIFINFSRLVYEETPPLAGNKVGSEHLGPERRGLRGRQRRGPRRERRETGSRRRRRHDAGRSREPTQLQVSPSSFFFFFPLPPLNN